MHPALEKLLQDIVDAADKEERHMNDLMIEFPMPPSNYLKGLGYGEQRTALYELATALVFSYYNPSMEKICWLKKSSSSREKYQQILEYWNIDKIITFHLELYYGDIELAIRIAKNEVEGGIHVIIKTLSENIKQSKTECRIRGLIFEGWGPWRGEWTETVSEGEGQYQTKKKVTHKTPLYCDDYEGRFKHVQSYKDRYKDFLPAEYLEENLAWSEGKFEETLLNHHKLARRMKGILN